MSNRHELMIRRIRKLTEKTIREKNSDEKGALKSQDSGQRAEASRHNRKEKTKLERTTEQMESLRLDEARAVAVADDDDGGKKPKENRSDMKVGMFDVNEYFAKKRIRERELFKKKYNVLPPKCKVCGYRGVRDERECYNYDKHYLLRKK